MLANLDMYCSSILHYAYELISRMNSTSYIHALIYSCPCIPAIFMYGHAHAHAHKPLMTRHHALIKHFTNKNFFSFYQVILFTVLLPMPCRHLSSMPSNSPLVSPTMHTFCTCSPQLFHNCFLFLLSHV